MENMAFFFTELTLMQYTLVLSKPSKVIAAAVYAAARITLNKTPLWTDTLKHHTGYAESQLL
jgi:cyclin B